MTFLNQGRPTVAAPTPVDARWVEVTYRLTDSRVAKCRGLRVPIALRALLDVGVDDECIYTKPHRICCVRSDLLISSQPLAQKRVPRWSRRIQQEEACLSRLGLS